MTTTASLPAEDGPVARVVPLRVARPSLRQSALIFASYAPLFALTALRPKQVPPALQRTADAWTAICVTGHPVEAFVVNRAARRAGVTASERRRVTFSSLLLGAPTTSRALWSLRRAYPKA